MPQVSFDQASNLIFNLTSFPLNLSIIFDSLKDAKRIYESEI
jgi:hypothetical protein